MFYCQKKVDFLPYLEKISHPEKQTTQYLDLNKKKTILKLEHTAAHSLASESQMSVPRKGKHVCVCTGMLNRDWYQQVKYNNMRYDHLDLPA